MGGAKRRDAGDEKGKSPRGRRRKSVGSRGTRRGKDPRGGAEKVGAKKERKESNLLKFAQCVL